MLRLAVLTLALYSAAGEQARLATKLSEMLQQSAVGVGQESSNLMAKQASEAIQALDTNKDRVIDWHEIEQFARSQGFNGAQAMKEFAAFDINKDGLLDMTEVGTVLGTQPKNLSIEKEALETRIEAMEDRQKQQAQPNQKQQQMATQQMSARPRGSSLAATQPTPSTKDPAIAVQAQANQKQLEMPAKQKSTRSIDTSMVATRPAPSDQVSALATKKPWYLQLAYAPKDVDKIMPISFAAEDAKQAFTRQKPAKVNTPWYFQPAYAPTNVDQKPIETFDNDIRTVFGKSSNLLESGHTRHARTQQNLGNVQVLVDRLAEEGKMESDAVELENMASTYHAESAKLAQQAMESALRAAQVASKEKSEGILATVQSMEDQALHAEVQAAAMHAKSVAEAQSAKDLMAVARKAMSRLRGLHV